MGIIFDCRIQGIKLEYGKFTKSLNEIMETQLRNAAREWLRAVVIATPVYSGESRGSLLPLAGYLHRHIDIFPAHAWKVRPPGPTSLGIEVGASRGSYSFTSTNYVYTFTFSTEVPQFLINEFNVGLGSPPLIHPTPWRALEAGENAINQYLDENILKRFPKVSDYVVLIKDLGL